MRDGTRPGPTAIRVALLVLVVAWLFSARLRSAIPFWLPLLALLAIELEVVVQAARQRRSDAAAIEAEPARRGPGPEDADLGWGEIVDDGEGGVAWIPPPHRARSSRGRRLATVVSVAAAIAVVAVGLREDAAATWGSLAAADRTTTERRLQAEAARIAGRPVRLRCDDGYAFTGTRSDALGIAFPRRSLTYLHPAICRTLHDVLRDERPSDGTVGEAIVVLAHEAVHLRPERREGVTECLALQEGVALGRRLGLSEAHAARLMRARYADALAERSLVRIEYRLPESCVDGGALDIAPGSGRFP